MTARPVPAALAASADHKLYGQPVLLYAGPASWLDVRFANAANGWFYGGLPNGGPILWSTHDGGASWHQQRLPGLGPDDAIFDLEAADGTVYFMATATSGTSVVVESSPVAKDAWRADRTPPLLLPAGGAQAGGAIVLLGEKGWLVEGNDRGITGSAELEGQGTWGRWAPPCQAVGNSYTVPATPNGTDFVAVCVMGGFGDVPPKHAPPRATLGSSWLYVSGNRGQSFRPGPELGPRNDIFGGVLASPRPASVVTSRWYDHEDLVASFDGGHHWQVVYRGYFFYLGFTSASQGVGLSEPPTGSSATTVMS